MILLNSLLAFGAAAFAIPLLIHLLNRNKFQTVDWGAMQLLQSSRNLNARRMQWKQLLLLLLRCALPVLLALAMARPLLNTWLSADGRSPISLAIVLDDSMSMFADPTSLSQTDSASHFSLACQSAAELLEALPAGSNAMLTLGGSKPESIAEQVPDLLATKIRALSKRSLPAGHFSLQDSLRPSLQWLSTSSHPRRQLVLISDFQKHEWSDMLSNQMADASKLIEDQAIRPSLAFLRVGQADTEKLSEPPNLAIDALELSPSVLAVEREATVSVVVGNHGQTRSERIQVALMADGIEIDRQQLVVDAGSTSQIRSRWSPKSVGDHILSATILRDDALAFDNSLATVAVVQEPFPILIVDGDLRNEPMQSEADFLRIALSPFSLLGGKKGDAFVSKTVSPEQWTEASLKNMRAVCLCNVKELNANQQKWVRTFVEQGGGLMGFLGDKVNIEQYQRWPSVANGGLRIAKFSVREKILAESPAGRLDNRRVEFPPIRDMSAASLASLADVRFEYRIPIELDPDTLPASAEASVALRFEDGKAFLLESKIGKGRCVWMSSSCDGNDSNLPNRSVFVPLVQRIATYVCASESPATQLTSNDLWTRKLTVPGANAAPTASRESKHDAYLLTRPDGIEVEIASTEAFTGEATGASNGASNGELAGPFTGPFTGERMLQFADTRLLGIYVAKPTANEPIEKSVHQKAFCVRSNSIPAGAESNLTSLTEEAMETLAALGKATVFNTTREFLAQSHADWHGREVWTWVWTALIVCFLAEIALEQSLATRSKLSAREQARQKSQGMAA